MQLPLVLAAVVPLLFWISGRRSYIGAAVVIASWIVFVVDFVVHVRALQRYVHTWRGRFDLSIVVITGPWSFLPFLADSGFLVVVRLARVARALLVTKHAKRLVEQLGRAFVVGVVMVVACSDIAYHAERTTNSEYKSYGDSLWWAIVTICTVGYGDITPKTTTGRWVGAVLMITGIGIIGALAGSLASFLRLTPAPIPGGGGARPRGAPAGAAPPDDLRVDEIARLRTQLAVLDTHLQRLERRREQTSESAGGPEAPP